MSDFRTPGIHVPDIDAFPPSVVEVATAVPAFLGYTEKAIRGAQDVTGVPVRISSMLAFEQVFGAGPDQRFGWSRDNAGRDTLDIQGQRFHLHAAMRLFFANGGGACWILSLGGFDAPSYGAGDVTDAIWQALADEAEPAMYLMPDAVALSRVAHRAICKRMMAECSRLGDRMAILDVYEGRGPGPNGPAPAQHVDKALNGPDGFRKIHFGDAPGFGAAYYPWLETTLHPGGSVDFRMLDTPSRTALADAVTTELAPPQDSFVAGAIASLTDLAHTSGEAAALHGALTASSQIYREVMAGLSAEVNILPPSAAMAGIWTRTDQTRGVWKAPANIAIARAAAPLIEITDAVQQDLNTPPSGLAVNAIRTFPGRGVVIWGARTLDGNNAEYRYINLRRTLIMLEQSMRAATEGFSQDVNGPPTWQVVKRMIEQYLIDKWRVGALAGRAHDQAYFVAVGLGTSMSATDILNGILRVNVGVALSRPAEFTLITFEQKMAGI